MELITLLNQAVTPKRGNRPNFDEAHVLLALSVIAKEQPIGRHLLMRKLGLTEATTRTLIKRLKELELIHIDKVAGILLSEKGKQLLNYVSEKATIIENVKLTTINWNAICIILRNLANIVGSVGILQLRDLIIRAGASKTLIGIVNQEGNVELPPKTFDESEEIRKLKEEIKEKLNKIYRINDLILFVEPQDIYLAYKIVVALLLLNGQKNLPTS